jgi:hypothetical protein
MIPEQPVVRIEHEMALSQTHFMVLWILEESVAHLHAESLSE